MTDDIRGRLAEAAGWNRPGTTPPGRGVPCEDWWRVDPEDGTVLVPIDDHPIPAYGHGFMDWCVERFRELGWEWFRCTGVWLATLDRGEVSVPNTGNDADDMGWLLIKVYEEEGQP